MADWPSSIVIIIWPINFIDLFSTRRDNYGRIFLKSRYISSHSRGRDKGGSRSARISFRISIKAVLSFYSSLFFLYGTPMDTDNATMIDNQSFVPHVHGLASRLTERKLTTNDKHGIISCAACGITLFFPTTKDMNFMLSCYRLWVPRNN